MFCIKKIVIEGVLYEKYSNRGGGGYEKDGNRGVCMKKLVIGLFV